MMNSSVKVDISKKQEKKSWGSLFLLVPYLKNYKLKIGFVIIALIITSLMVLFLGKIVHYLVDFGFASHDQRHLNLSLIGFLLAAIVLGIAGYFRSAIINEVGEKVVANLRQKIYRHIIFTSNQFFENNKIGDVIARLTVDTTLLYNIISNSISFFLRNLLLFFGGLTFLFLTSAKLTLIALALLPLIVIPIIFIGKRVKNSSQDVQAKIANLSSHIEESINAIKTIQAYQNEEKEAENFNKLSEDALQTSIAKIRIRSFLVSTVIICAFSFVGIVLWLGSNEVLKGQMSAGNLFSFIFYAVISATSIVAISQIMGQLQIASGAASRIFDLLKIESAIKERINPVKLPNSAFLGENLSLEFRNVNFTYPSRLEAPILQNFNLKIASKEKIAITGPSGSGKSTILELLMRFFDVNSGQVLINGIDVKDLALKDLRSLFSYIAQDCFIFSGTIFENIAYTNKKVNKEQVLKLVSSNKAFAFILDLPSGIDSFVGQKGVMLSGGQRQRIAILRAFVNDAPILLLDEATSALDHENEKLITGLMASLMKDKMVIFVAHHLSRISEIDRVITLTPNT